MALASLIVCADAEAVHVLTDILHGLGVEPTNCANPSAAKERLPENRFDIVVVDCQHEASSTALISSIRNSPLQRNSVIVALVKAGSRASETFETGANLLLYKPLSRERALHSLNTAKGLIRHERRVKVRIPVQVPASIAYAGKEDAAATVVEISETGIGIQSLDNLPQNAKIYFHFTLPGQDTAIRLAGEVMWRAASGRVGVRFVNVPQASKKILQRWVEEQSGVGRGSASNADSKSKLTVRFSTGLGLLSSSAPDRRNLSRKPCCLGAEIYRADGQVPHRCTLSDISTGGCYVETTEPFTEGTVLTIVVRTLDLKVCVAGKVQSMNRGYGMGVRFNLNTENERLQVQQLLACAEQNSRVLR
ncbi:MAG: response regulator [Acidobacteriaceae bacterium]|nr:response regulator [Acidobacteriaceae bacterium]